MFNVLLQVLDDGRLTDGQGRTVDFKNTLIIMTSNLGAEFLADPRQPMGFGMPGDNGQGDERGGRLRSGHGRGAPSLPARIHQPYRRDRRVPPPAREAMAAIVDIQMKRLQALVADRKITIELDDQARTWLANKGYDPIYGARPLKRVIQKHVQDPLAEEILRGTVKDGDTVASLGAGRQAAINEWRSGGAGEGAAAGL